jgi:hypothetical protein
VAQLLDGHAQRQLVARQAAELLGNPELAEAGVHPGLRHRLLDAAVGIPLLDLLLGQVHRVPLGDALLHEHLLVGQVKIHDYSF